MGKTDPHPLDQDFREDIVDAERVSPGLSLLVVLKAIASLRLTVILFVLAFILVFLGTVAQVDASNWTVVKSYFRTAFVMVPNQVLLRFCQTFFGVSKETEWPGSFPFPGGWLIGSLLLINLIAAHLSRFRLSWKRSGILILHAGLIVLMLGELGTGLTAIEGNMTIPTGKSSNYLEHLHAVELAIIDHSNADTDEVVVVPDWMLKKGGLITDSKFPFDIDVVEYMPNSDFEKGIPKGMNNPATAGFGLRVAAIEKKEGSGVDSNQKIDIPSAYLTFKKKASDQTLGTHLVSMYYSFFKLDEQIIVDGKTYDLALRLKRSYKPYRIYLKEFHHDRYMGTEMARNFSSQVRLVDPEENEDREFNISMNNPLRHAGETFYQSSVLGEDEGTILQVVRNPVWWMPYVSCVMVALGMMIHFGINLTGFLRRKFGATGFSIHGWLWILHILSGGLGR